MIINIVSWCVVFAELSEDTSLAIGPNPDDGPVISAEDDQTTFEVKYVGNIPVDSAAVAVAEAVKTILTVVSIDTTLWLSIIVQLVRVHSGASRRRLEARFFRWLNNNATLSFDV